ncbi:hypothetical protein GE061_013113 [Apolygus lucorum]|uniref:Uncharacterized protein n=1 Tax=Apolygus lucorum TaxID=248454 RepID=A0A8S9XUI1_APOLU|nr:hypothetical protein GE061_013113 [Apolygus lucorum]
MRTAHSRISRRVNIANQQIMGNILTPRSKEESYVEEVKLASSETSQVFADANNYAQDYKSEQPDEETLRKLLGQTYEIYLDWRVLFIARINKAALNMIDPGVCCLDEDEFEQKIRVSKDARMRMMDKPKVEEGVKDLIGEAETKGRNEFLEEEEMFMRAARLDVKTIFYLEDRMKSCYKLRNDVEAFGPLLNCFKDSNLKPPVDCECDVRNYLREINKEKHQFAEEISKMGPKKKEKGKDDKAKGKDDKDGATPAPTLRAATVSHPPARGEETEGGQRLHPYHQSCYNLRPRKTCTIWQPIPLIAQQRSFKIVQSLQTPSKVKLKCSSSIYIALNPRLYPANPWKRDHIDATPDYTLTPFQAT